MLKIGVVFINKLLPRLPRISVNGKQVSKKNTWSVNELHVSMLRGAQDLSFLLSLPMLSLTKLSLTKLSLTKLSRLPHEQEWYPASPRTELLPRPPPWTEMLARHKHGRRHRHKHRNESRGQAETILGTLAAERSGTLGRPHEQKFYVGLPMNRNP